MSPFFKALAFVALMAAPPEVIAQGIQAPRSDSAKATTPSMTAEERLSACAKKYAEATTYSDEGVVVTEFTLPSTRKRVREERPFRTLFERGGRFMWQFRGVTQTGKKAEHTFSVWSRNQSSFKMFCTLEKQRLAHPSLDTMMTILNRQSGGSSLAVVPLLRPDALARHLVTSLKDGIDKGTQRINGHECTRIEGTIQGNTYNREVTIWIDKELAIRRIREVADKEWNNLPADATPNAKRITVGTTIDFKPKFNEALDDTLFKPPADDALFEEPPAPASPAEKSPAIRPPK
jgi:hypothetical protein